MLSLDSLEGVLLFKRFWQNLSLNKIKLHMLTILTFIHSAHISVYTFHFCTSWRTLSAKCISIKSAVKVQMQPVPVDGNETYLGVCYYKRKQSVEPPSPFSFDTFSMFKLCCVGTHENLNKYSMVKFYRYLFPLVKYKQIIFI